MQCTIELKLCLIPFLGRRPSRQARIVSPEPRRRPSLGCHQIAPLLSATPPVGHQLHYVPSLLRMCTVAHISSKTRMSALPKVPYFALCHVSRTEEGHKVHPRPDGVCQRRTANTYSTQPGWLLRKRSTCAPRTTNRARCCAACDNVDQASRPGGRQSSDILSAGNTRLRFILTWERWPQLRVAPIALPPGRELM